MLTRIIKHLLKVIPAQRGYKLHEEAVPYGEDLLSPTTEAPLPE